MATLRGLFVVRLAKSMRADAEESRVVLCRRFGTVETRARRDHGSSFIPLPPVTDTSALCRTFAESFSTTASSSLSERVPLRNVSTLSSGLWPVCHIRMDDVFFIAVPLLTTASRASPASSLATISSTFGILADVAALATPFHPRYDPQNVAELLSLLALALPFGTPQLPGADTVQLVRRMGLPSEPLQTRVPGWRPVWQQQQTASATGAAAGRVELTIEETVNAVQYDNPAIPDTCCIAGSVLARVELEGPQPEVTLTAAADDMVQRFSTHACAQQLMAGELLLTPDGVRVQLTAPPPAPFTLATYAVQRPPKPLPFRGFFQLREDGPTRAKLLLQLKLDASVANNFQFLEVVVPFRNRGSIAAIQATPSTGSVTAAASQQASSALIWNIGTRISAANLELSMLALVTFDAAAVPDSSDPFCTGANCCAQVRFKVLRWAPSSLTIDPKKISVYPVSKVKPVISVERCCVSGDYIIWNSLGKSRVAKPLILQ